MQTGGYEFLGDCVVNSSKAFAVSVDEAFMAVVVVLYPSPSGTLEYNADLVLAGLELAIVHVLSLYLESFRLHFKHETVKVVSMVFLTLISTHEVDSSLFAVLMNVPLNKDVLENALRRDSHEGYISNWIGVSLHFTLFFLNINGFCRNSSQ